ncbi:MAG: hypothetical protein R3E18_08565 [Sphingomonadaceae bacterium]|nr:hypothetical protein [Sphingomonadaceae bacterium]
MSLIQPQPAGATTTPEIYAPPGRITFDPWLVIAFFYPLTQLLMVELGGQLYLMDFAGIVLLGFMIRQPGSLQRLAQIRVLLIFMGLWLLCQVATDIYRSIPMEDFLRGWGRIIFFAIQVCALWLFLPRDRNYILAFGFGLSIALVFNVPENFIESPWKFGYAQGLMMFTACLLSVPSRLTNTLREFAPLIFLAVAAFLLTKVARSAFAISTMTAGVCLAFVVLNKFGNAREAMKPWMFALLLIGGIGATGILTTVYENAADSGALGRDAQVKYRKQSGGDLPLLLGGRPESLISVVAIQDSPILGHGSWAKNRRYLEMYRTLRIRWGIDFPKTQYVKDRRIPAHSYFFGSWVESGIFGAIFWLYAFTIPLVATYWLLKRGRVLVPLGALLAISMVWNIPFSPFGATERFTAAFAIVTLLAIIKAARVKRGPGELLARNRRSRPAAYPPYAPAQ